MSKRKLSLKVHAETVQAGRTLAKRLGYVTDRGSFKGQGSISEMLDAIGRGELEVRRSKPSDDRSLT